MHADVEQHAHVEGDGRRLLFLRCGGAAAEATTICCAPRWLLWLVLVLGLLESV